MRMWRIDPNQGKSSFIHHQTPEIRGVAPYMPALWHTTVTTLAVLPPYRIQVLHPTRHKIGHFGDVSQANLLAWYGKTNTTKAHIHQSKQNTTTQNKHEKLKPGLVTSYDIQPGIVEGLFLFCRFRNLSLTYLDAYPLTYSPGPTEGLLVQQQWKVVVTDVDRPHGVSQFSSAVDSTDIQHGGWLNKLAHISHRRLPTAAAKLPHSIETT